MGCACTPQHGRSADAAARGRRAKGGNGADNPGRLEDDYIVSAMIGKGHYGSVYKGICRRTGAVVAVKVIDKSKSRKKRLELEVNILRRIHRHPNVITLLDVYHTQDHVNLVLEMCEGGELFDKLVDKGPFKERQAATLCRKLASALRYMHKRDVVHRDLKPENILLADKSDDADVKLADFGLSRFRGEDDELMTTAPEVRIYRRGYDKSVDMWSLGVILFVVLSGYHPFDPEGCAPEDDLQRAIKKGDYDFDDPVWEGVSDGARDLIRKLIQVNPKKRLTAAEVMKHPWVKKFAPRLHKRDRASHVSSMSQSKKSRDKRRHGRRSRASRTSRASAARATGEREEPRGADLIRGAEETPRHGDQYSTSMSHPMPLPGAPEVSPNEPESDQDDHPRLPGTLLGDTTDSKRDGDRPARAHRLAHRTSLSSSGGSSGSDAGPQQAGGGPASSGNDSDSSDGSDSSDSSSSDDSDSDGDADDAEPSKRDTARKSGSSVRGAEPTQLAGAAASAQDGARIMDMDSGEVIEGSDFALIHVARAPSPGPRRGRQSKRHLRGGQSSRRMQPRHGHGVTAGGVTHHVAREVGELMVTNDRNGGNSRGGGGGGGGLMAMKSDEVLTVENVGDVDGDGDAAQATGVGGMDAAGTGLMAELEEGEIMTAQLSDDEASAEYDDAPQSGVMARLGSGEAVTTLQEDEVDNAALDAGYDGALRDGDSEGSHAFGYMDALVSGEEIAEDMLEEVDANRPADQWQLPGGVDDGSGQISGNMARLHSGEEVCEAIDNVALGDLEPGMGGRALLGADDPGAAPDSAALARMASGEILSEEMEGGLDLSQMPNVFSRAHHAAITPHSMHIQATRSQRGAGLMGRSSRRMVGAQSSRRLRR